MKKATPRRKAARQPGTRKIVPRPTHKPATMREQEAQQKNYLLEEEHPELWLMLV